MPTADVLFRKQEHSYPFDAGYKWKLQCQVLLAQQERRTRDPVPVVCKHFFPSFLDICMTAVNLADRIEESKAQMAKFLRRAMDS